MITPKAKRGTMPEVFSIDDDLIEVKVRFMGIKRWRLVKQTPYFNYSQPQIKLNISLKSDDWEIENIVIRCYEPKKAQSEFQSQFYPYSVVWNAKRDAKIVQKNFDYEIILPKIRTAGEDEYTYHLDVDLSSTDKNKQKTTTHRGDLILSTGYIEYREKMFIAAIKSIAYLIVGGLVMLAVLWSSGCIQPPTNIP